MGHLGGATKDSSRLYRALWIALGITIAVMTSAPAHSQPLLVANIATGPEPDKTSDPSDFRECNGLTYFTASGGGSRNLWRTDKSTGGTISLGPVASPYYRPTPILHAAERGCIYFSTTTNGSDNASELWRTDGTPEGTFPLKQGTIVTPFEPATIMHEGLVFFSANDCELWQTDGTEAGTRLVARICPARIRPAFGELHGHIFFLTEEIFGRRLWSSDGTQGGTRPLTQILAPSRDAFLAAPTFISLGETLFFIEDQQEDITHLWRSDGSEAGTFWLSTSERPAFAALDDRLVFLRDTEEFGVEPWLSDGTPEGTFLLTDINQGPHGSISNDDDWYFPSFFEWNDLLFFVAFDPDHGYEPWRSDGTGNGTYRLHDVNPGPARGIDSDALQFDSFSFSAFGDSLIFPADDGVHGVELWRSDGTSEATMLADIFAGSESSYPTRVVATRNGAVFGAAAGKVVSPGTSAYDSELWHTDATPGGTYLVADIGGESRAGRPSQLAAAGEQAIFVANDGSGSEPWLTDGTSGGTFLLRDLFPTDASASPEELIDFGGTLAFAAVQNVVAKLWISTGQNGSTREVVSTIHPDGFANARHLTPAGDRLAFTASDSTGRTLFLSDTPAGAPRAVRRFDDVFDIHPWGDLFLLAANGGDGPALWVSDGTTDGTMALTSPSDGFPETFATTSTHVFFTTRYNPGLWRTDGTQSGTILIQGFSEEGPSINSRIVAADDRLYYVLQSCHLAQLWAVDGSQAEPRYVTDLNLNDCDYYPRPVEMSLLDDALFIVSRAPDGWEALFRLDGSVLTQMQHPDIAGSPTALTPVRHLLYFVASNSATGRELWRTDGTEAGTVMIKDIVPGPGGSDPQHLTSVDDSLVFSADDGEHGREAWTTCGSAADATRFTDIAPANASANPASFVASDDELFLVADDRSHGVELWSTAWPLPSTCDASSSSSGGGCAIGPRQPSTLPISLLILVGPLLLRYALRGKARSDCHRR